MFDSFNANIYHSPYETIFTRETAEREHATASYLAHLPGGKAGGQAAFNSSLHRLQDTGKLLRVVNTPQNKRYVPSIRVAGKWLASLGFRLDDRVRITASYGRIVITRDG